MNMFHERIKKLRKDQVYEMPEQPMAKDAILKRMVNDMEYSKQYYTKGGNISGGVYTSDEDHWKFIGEVMSANITTNPLHIFEFPQIA